MGWQRASVSALGNRASSSRNSRGTKFCAYVFGVAMPLSVVVSAASSGTISSAAGIATSRAQVHLPGWPRIGSSAGPATGIGENGSSGGQIGAGLSFLELIDDRRQ